MRLLVTGAAGFIGSALVRVALAAGHKVLSFDALMRAGRIENLAAVRASPHHRFVRGDVRDAEAVATAFEIARPDAVVHLAAESHVDVSIAAPAPCVSTNVLGTLTLLQAGLEWWEANGRPEHFRFLQVSTDEVFGALGPTDPPFTGESPCRPSSPYAASKAAADHLALAWARTWGLPVIVTHGTNTYGPNQHPEKLIPRAITSALAGLPIPLYGSGAQVRDWIHVEDHARALLAALEGAPPARRWLIGARNELSNRVLIGRICTLLDEVRPAHAPHARLIRHVADRPGHDFRYAVDPRPFMAATGWAPSVPFPDGLKQTVVACVAAFDAPGMTRNRPSSARPVQPLQAEFSS